MFQETPSSTLDGNENPSRRRGKTVRRLFRKSLYTPRYALLVQDNQMSFSDAAAETHRHATTLLAPHRPGIPLAPPYYLFPPHHQSRSGGHRRHFHPQLQLPLRSATGGSALSIPDAFPIRTHRRRRRCMNRQSLPRIQLSRDINERFPFQRPQFFLKVLRWSPYLRPDAQTAPILHCASAASFPSAAGLQCTGRQNVNNHRKMFQQYRPGAEMREA